MVKDQTAFIQVVLWFIQFPYVEGMTTYLVLIQVSRIFTTVFKGKSHLKTNMLFLR